MNRHIFFSSRRAAGLGQDDGIDWAEIISASTTGAANIIKANKQPAYPYAGIPGVNPQTGQFFQPQSTLGLNLNSTTLILVVAVAAMVMMKR